MNAMRSFFVRDNREKSTEGQKKNHGKDRNEEEEGEGEEEKEEGEEGLFIIF